MRELSQYHRSVAPNIISWIALENSGVYEIGKCCSTACVCAHTQHMIVAQAGSHALDAKMCNTVHVDLGCQKLCFCMSVPRPTSGVGNIHDEELTSRWAVCLPHMFDRSTLLPNRHSLLVSPSPVLGALSLPVMPQSLGVVQLQRAKHVTNGS